MPNTTWKDLVEAHIPDHDEPATEKQRAYMVVLVFSKDVTDQQTDLVLNLFDRSDLPKSRASQVIDLLTRQPSLSAAQIRARAATFGKEQLLLKNSMSAVLQGQPWPGGLSLK